jgi:hypothetical protein
VQGAPIAQLQLPKSVSNEKKIPRLFAGIVVSEKSIAWNKK